MNKRVFILISLSAILLSGCMTLRMETKIKEDGSGSKSLVVALDKDAISTLEGMAGEDMDTGDFWEETRKGADLIEGAKVEDYSDDDSEGIRITVPFDNLAELEALSGSDVFEGADTVTVSQEGDTVTLRATVSAGGDLTSGLGEAGGEDLEGMDMGDIEIEFSYSVDVEGKILEHSPADIAKVKGSKVTWDLSQVSSESVDLMVKWEPGSSGGESNMLMILLIVIALGGVGLVVVGVLMTVLRKEPPASDLSF